MPQPEQLSAVVAELHAIRMTIAAGVVFVAIAALLSFIRVMRQLGVYAERDYGDRFTVKMENLFETGRLDVLEERCRERLAGHPNHAMALWYLGRALYLRGEEADARETFKRLRRVHPGWARDHIDPYLAEMASRDAAPRTDH